MASIDITTQSGAVGNGDLQLQNGAPMDATLRFVTDAVNTASPLKLSTSLVQTTSTLKITTNDNPYIDAEDGSGNNRFTVGRAPASQQVNVDFASNPAGSTTAVGAIRTFRDGTNLSEAMTFIEDGSVGIGTTTPVGLLDLYKAAAATRLAIRGDAGQNRLISYRTGALQRFGLYVNNTAESGSNAGSNFAIRAYDDAGTLLSTPLFIQRSSGFVGIGTTTPVSKLQVTDSNGVVGTFTSSSFFGSIDLENTGGSVPAKWNVQSVSGAQVGGTAGSSFGIYSYGASAYRMFIDSSGNVGIGTISPTAGYKFDVRGRTIAYNLGYIADFVSTESNASSIQLYADNTNVSIVQSGTAAVPLTFFIGGTERMRIATSGNVGIGTAAPAKKLDVYTSVNSASEIQLSLRNGDANNNITTGIGFGFNSTALDPDYLGAIYSTITNRITRAADINFLTASTGTLTEKVKITSDGYLRLNVNSGGIQFNGDTAAANALDDYEEGTWTPIVTFGGGSVGQTYSANQGTYTKIGRQVSVTCYVEFTNKGTSTGAGVLTGLPFTIGSGTAFFGAPSVGDVRNITFIGILGFYSNQGQTTITMGQTSTLGTFTVLNETNFANNSEFILTATYFV